MYKLFKALGVVFSLNTKALYELNFVPKLGIIEQILNLETQKFISFGEDCSCQIFVASPVVVFVQCPVYQSA